MRDAWTRIYDHINCLHAHRYLKVSKVGDEVEDDPKVSFHKLLYRGVGEGTIPVPGILHFTLDPYLIMLSVKQGDIKKGYFKALGLEPHHQRHLSFWYDLTWDWTSVSRTIGEHSTHAAIDI